MNQHEFNKTHLEHFMRLSPPDRSGNAIDEEGSPLQAL